MTNREFFIQRYMYEHPIFVKICEAVPPDQLEWRPHQKSRSAKELLGHLIGHEHDLIELSNDGVINHRNQVPFTNLAQAVELSSDVHRSLSVKLLTLDEKTWEVKPAKVLAVSSARTCRGAYSGGASGRTSARCRLRSSSR